MEALVDYMFVNAEDIKNVHYIKIMELLLKAYVLINSNKRPAVSIPTVLAPIITTRQMDTRSSDDREISNLVNNYQITKIVTISFEKWMEIKDTWSFSESLFNSKLKEIAFLPEEPITSVRIIFPSCLNNLDRQKFHIKASTEGFESYTQGRYTNTNNLNIFLPINYFN